MKDFLEELGITQAGNISDDGNYVVDFNTYDDWCKAQSKLERSDLVDEDENSSVVGEENQSLQYIGDEFTITMAADLDADEYQLIVREN